MLVQPTSLETARSFIYRTLERALDGLMALAGLLAFASVPGTLLGLIPWPLCAALWGITVASMVLGELVSERIARAQADARLRKPAFRNYSPRSRCPPPSGVQPLPLP